MPSIISRAALLLLAVGAMSLPGQEQLSATIDPQVPAALRAQLERVAREYPAWGWVDSEARRAPFLCRMPLPSAVRESRAAKDTPHGEKLYGLYALHPTAYAPGPHKIFLSRPPVMAGFGQILVKESFHPRRIPRSEYVAPRHAGLRNGTQLAPLIEEDEVLLPDRPGPLFIMAQVARGTPGTDEGWLYATFSREGTKAQLTALGNLESCRACHVRAGEGRLFGLKGFGTPEPVEVVKEDAVATVQGLGEFPIDRKLPTSVLTTIEAVALERAIWPRVTTHLLPAPEFCGISPRQPKDLFLSGARGERLHGGKLYHLRASHPEAYTGTASETGSPFARAGFGQILVKETWHKTPFFPDGGDRPTVVPSPGRVHLEGKSWRQGPPGPLFLMLSVPAGTPGSHLGWVYAEVDANGPWPQLRRAGALQDCRACHDQAPHHGLFGITDEEAPSPGHPQRVPIHAR